MLAKKTLEQLIELARTRSDRATSELGVSRTREHEEQGRLRLLTDYRMEYQARFDAASRAGIASSDWSNYREFIARLDVAIRQQSELLERQRRNVEHRRGEWQVARRRQKSFDTLEQRRLQGERSVEQRRGQREQDEFAGRRSNRQT